MYEEFGLFHLIIIIYYIIYNMYIVHNYTITCTGIPTGAQTASELMLAPCQW